MAPNDSFEQLYQRWLEHELSEEDTLRFFQLISEQEEPPTFMKGAWDKFIPSVVYSTEEKRALAEKIMGTATEDLAIVLPRRTFSVTWLRYAAVLLLAIGASVYWWMGTQPGKSIPPDITSVPAADIAPGGNKAILVLADESVINLDSASNGQLTTQGSSAVVKTANGELLYTNGSKKEDKAVYYQKLITPRGGQYQVTLSDGTQVWLNAASSIRFPSFFVGNAREVEVTGEVYFEVAANASMPFKVKLANHAEIDVLGTSFNVKAYSEEPEVRTTLVSGKVKISRNQVSQVLSPGNQAVINNNITIAENVDTEQVTAWKNGLFNFSGSDVPSMMREIGRWYDLEVVYVSHPKKRTITGKMQRSLTLLQLMNILSGLDLHCRLEGKKLILAD